MFKKTTIFRALGFCGAVMLATGNAAADVKIVYPKEATDLGTMGDAGSKNGYALFVMKEGCAQCRVLLQSLTNYQPAYDATIYVVTNKYASPAFLNDVAKKYNIIQMPALIITDKNDRVAKRCDAGSCNTEYKKILDSTFGP